MQQAPHRSLFNALGMTEEEMKKPMVGIVSSYNEIVPGHMNIDKIVEAVKLGVAMAGGTPVVFPAIAVCDGIAMGHIGMKYSLVTREDVYKRQTVTRVKGGYGKQGTVTHPVAGEGTFGADAVAYLSLPEDLLVEKLYLRPGDPVQAGETVLTLQAERLEEVRGEQADACRKAELALEQERLSARTYPRAVSYTHLAAGCL